MPMTFNVMAWFLRPVALEAHARGDAALRGIQATDYDPAGNMFSYPNVNAYPVTPGAKRSDSRRLFVVGQRDERVEALAA